MMLLLKLNEKNYKETMMMIKHIRINLIFLLFLLQIFLTQGTRSQITDDKNIFYSDWGIIVGFMAPYNSFAGDFSGKKFVQDRQVTVFTPKIESNFGYGGRIGLMNERAAWELYFQISNNKTNIEEVNAPTKAKFSMIGTELKLKFYNQPRFHPYLTLGAGVGAVEVTNGGIRYEINDYGRPTSKYEYGRPEYFNYMITGGVGGIFYLTPLIGTSWLCLNGEVYYRYFNVNEFTLYDVSFRAPINNKFDEKISVSSFNAILALSIMVFL